MTIKKKKKSIQKSFVFSFPALSHSGKILPPLKVMTKLPQAALLQDQTLVRLLVRLATCLLSPRAENTEEQRTPPDQGKEASTKPASQCYRQNNLHYAKEMPRAY